MAVTCLTQHQKSLIIVRYSNKSMTQKEMAKCFDVSERTINRVLIEAGLATPVARIKGEAYQVMQLLKKYNITSVDQLEKELLQARFTVAA